MAWRTVFFSPRQEIARLRQGAAAQVQSQAPTEGSEQSLWGRLAMLRLHLISRISVSPMPHLSAG